MRLGTCLLFEGRTLQGAHPKLAYFCAATVAGFYTAVDKMPKDQGADKAFFRCGCANVRFSIG